MKITKRNLKLIIENYLLEEEEPSAEDLPQEEEEGESEEPADDSASVDDDAESGEEEKEKKAKDIVSAVARIAHDESVAKAVEKIKSSLEFEKPDFEIDISAVPQLVDIFGKESIKKVDVENLPKNPDNRIARSREAMKNDPLPGGFA